MHTWLDLYPPSDLPTLERHARLTARVDKIKETLTSLQRKIDIRHHLVALSKTNGKYCTTCGCSPLERYCSRTCPLLRQVQRGWLKSDAHWVDLAKQDVDTFDALTRSIDMHGHKANKQMVLDWELSVAHLLRRTEDAETREFVRARTSIPGFDKDWTF